MVRYESDGVFEAPLELVWKIVEEHGDPEKKKEHHPYILDMEVLERGDNWLTVIETFEGPDGPTNRKMKMVMDPPNRWTAEILGGLFEGATMEHTYEEQGDRTRVHLEGEFPVPEGMAEEQVRKMLEETWTAAFREDQQVLKRMQG